METTSSTEFLEEVAFLQWERWDHDHPIYHYLAQIAYEISLIRYGLAQKTPPKKETFLLKFQPETTGTATSMEKPAVAVPMSTMSTSGRKSITPGPEAVKDPKWARVNEEAKAMWAFRLRKGMHGDST